MVKATPAAPFKVTQPDLLFKLLIITLDAPAQLGGIDQVPERESGRNPCLGKLVSSMIHASIGP